MWNETIIFIIKITNQKMITEVKIKKFLCL